VLNDFGKKSVRFLTRCRESLVTRDERFVTETINFFFDVQESRFEIADHWIVDRRVTKRLVDLLLEDFLALFKYRNVGAQHDAFSRLAKILITHH